MKQTHSLLDSNVDFESHAIIDSPPHNHQHTTGKVHQHFQCFDSINHAFDCQCQDCNRNETVIVHGAKEDLPMIMATYTETV